MTLPRATSSDADDLAATISGLKSRLNELESAAGAGDAPAGSIVDFIGSVAPNGWTLLDGGTITNGRVLYPRLWAVLPSTFKSGNDIVKPDTRGKVTVHQGGTLLTGAIGTSTGQETVALLETELPTHKHTISHTHTYNTYTLTTASSGFSGGIGPALISATLTTNTGSGTTSAASTSDSGNVGSGTAHLNIQPSFIVVKIMRLG